MGRILLINPNTILFEGILSVLSGESDFEVTNYPENDTNLKQMVEVYQPDVVILNENLDSHGSWRLLEVLKSISHLKVITMGMLDNQVQVYTKHTLDFKNRDDFIRAVREGTAHMTSRANL